ncbi:CubicO group peptidase, beta-lactamase class C family [Actinacidiphila yanglinensis]|uniref:CubicO group peptidase, beta-lactamase class C family n=1 Tax=Actinacidiphila yanglinensis TaxID=310779 RepID=A0A1H6AJN7_9ACTN|nr:serine hydrolase domain-containing protein [Actinacidiphila yanglinensis]SEG48225.1 CubicO group peptidase, beta-lactamase class C family [Actinacidiphila yanglinensis]
MDWTECPPEDVGVDRQRLGRVTELVRARGAVSQLCVLRDGKVLLDRSFGCDPDALFLTFSAGKPLVALLVHLLAERGGLALDDPVSRHWPEFGEHGKEAVTVRQVLQHRSGMSTARGMLGDALAMTDWERSVRGIERAPLRHPPGQAPAYQVIIYGFVLGELVRRVTGTPPRELLRTEFLAPLGLRDLHLGLPDGAWSRHVPVRGRGTAARLSGRALNRRATRRAVIPSAGVSVTARDLARFYAMLLRGGELDGTRVLAPDTVREARRLSSDDEVDRVIRLPIRWAQGFQLGGPPRDAAHARPMGRHSSEDAFGHNGSNCCLAWADPGRGLVFVHLTDLLTGGHEGARHQSAVSDAVITSCA